ncbi:MAG: response regulator transcription factor [Clostridia bacterium]|nr:response regulator transcription factor [Clostridia bacterium]
MKILLAVPDRDLLSGLHKYLVSLGCEVATAHDGVIAIERLRESQLDAALVDDDLPRVPLDSVLDALSGAGVRATVLTKRRINAKMLCGKVCADSYISYPFLPEEIASWLGAAPPAGDGFSIAGVGVSLAARKLGGRSLTAEEIRLLRELSAGGTLPCDVPIYYIEAINVKLASEGATCSVRYFAGEGFRVVMKDE